MTKGLILRAPGTTSDRESANAFAHGGATTRGAAVNRGTTDLPAVGGHFAQMFHSSPQEGSENIRLMYLLSIAAARQLAVARFNCRRAPSQSMAPVIARP